MCGFKKSKRVSKRVHVSLTAQQDELQHLNDFGVHKTLLGTNAQVLSSAHFVVFILILLKDVQTQRIRYFFQFVTAFYYHLEFIFAFILTRSHFTGLCAGGLQTAISHYNMLMLLKVTTPIAHMRKPYLCTLHPSDFRKEPRGENCTDTCVEDVCSRRHMKPFSYRQSNPHFFSVDFNTSLPLKSTCVTSL